jgi:hypothetical protein
MFDVAPFYRLVEMLILAAAAAMIVPVAICTLGELRRARAEAALRRPRYRR